MLPRSRAETELLIRRPSSIERTLVRIEEIQVEVHSQVDRKKAVRKRAPLRVGFAARVNIGMLCGPARRRSAASVDVAAADGRESMIRGDDDVRVGVE